jgi:hypothetical protein
VGRGEQRRTECFFPARIGRLGTGICPCCLLACVERGWEEGAAAFGEKQDWTLGFMAMQMHLKNTIGRSNNLCAREYVGMDMMGPTCVALSCTYMQSTPGCRVTSNCLFSLLLPASRHNSRDRFPGLPMFACCGEVIGKGP